MARHPFYCDRYVGVSVKDLQNVLSEVTGVGLCFPWCSFEDPLNGAGVICKEVYCMCVVKVVLEMSSSASLFLSRLDVYLHCYANGSDFMPIVSAIGRCYHLFSSCLICSIADPGWSFILAISQTAPSVLPPTVSEP
jgi:hypothetical protein